MCTSEKRTGVHNCFPFVFCLFELMDFFFFFSHDERCSSLTLGAQEHATCITPGGPALQNSAGKPLEMKPPSHPPTECISLHTLRLVRRDCKSTAHCTFRAPTSPPQHKPHHSRCACFLLILVWEKVGSEICIQQGVVMLCFTVLAMNHPPPSPRNPTELVDKSVASGERYCIRETNVWRDRSESGVGHVGQLSTAQ